MFISFTKDPLVVAMNMKGMGLSNLNSNTGPQIPFCIEKYSFGISLDGPVMMSAIHSTFIVIPPLVPWNLRKRNDSSSAIMERSYVAGGR